VDFPISGVEVSPFVPLVMGFLVACLTTPAGVSGAFLLLPFQFSVLDFTAPGVTPTNLLYNVISTPGSILSYRRFGIVDWELVRRIAAGAAPAVVVGAILRVTVFEDPGDFKVFVGIVLLGLGANLVLQSLRRRNGAPLEPRTIAQVWITVLGAGAGIIGGIYGISGGSIIAPVLAGVFRIPVKRVAPAALVATLLTSVAGVIAFEILDRFAQTNDPARRPDWLLALLFGIGGAAGGFVGARLNVRLPEISLRALLGVLALVLAVTYVAPAL
jgi:uncharacterized membrane protein YfcA